MKELPPEILENILTYTLLSKKQNLIQGFKYSKLLNFRLICQECNEVSKLFLQRTTLHRVFFKIHYITQFGEELFIQFFILNNYDILTERFVKMSYNEGNYWTLDFVFYKPVYMLQYRYYCINSSLSLQRRESFNSYKGNHSLFFSPLPSLVNNDDNNNNNLMNNVNNSISNLSMIDQNINNINESGDDIGEEFDDNENVIGDKYVTIINDWWGREREVFVPDTCQFQFYILFHFKKISIYGYYMKVWKIKGINYFIVLGKSLLIVNPHDNYSQKLLWTDPSQRGLYSEPIRHGIIWHDNNFITGGDDGYLRIWDEDFNQIPIATFNYHKFNDKRITTLCANSSSLFVGHMNNTLLIFNRQFEVIKQIKCGCRDNLYLFDDRKFPDFISITDFAVMWIYDEREEYSNYQIPSLSNVSMAEIIKWGDFLVFGNGHCHLIYLLNPKEKEEEYQSIIQANILFGHNVKCEDNPIVKSKLKFIQKLHDDNHLGKYFVLWKEYLISVDGAGNIRFWSKELDSIYCVLSIKINGIKYVREIFILSDILHIFTGELLITFDLNKNTPCS